jgi:tetratricopeptide (TPR) repeat protein
MNKTLLIISLLFIQYIAKAQDAKHLHEMGKNYLVEGDYPNAEEMLINAFQKDSLNLSIIKDLTLCLYFEKDFKRALFYINTTFEKGIADDQCYQIEGNIYKEMNQLDEAKKVFAKGIGKYPQNGAFYNELGEIAEWNHNPECIIYWEKGIEKDAEYPKNYYNACKYYNAINNNIWCILYGEIYANMDPIGKKTPKIKEMILDSYKKLFSDWIKNVPLKEKNKFAEKINAILGNQSSMASEGITLSNLMIIRTRFILDWYNDKSEKFPFKLFDFHQKLLKEGLFEAYNQWLFGSSENLVAFQNWTQLHNIEYANFMKLLKSGSFKIAKDQYYH